MVNDFYYYFYKEIILYLRLMQKYNNIKAVLFLFLFSIYLLHQSVPHFHHEHEEIANNVIEHSHDHDQNGNDIPEKNNSPLGNRLYLRARNQIVRRKNKFPKVCVAPNK